MRGKTLWFDPDGEDCWLEFVVVWLFEVRLGWGRDKKRGGGVDKTAVAFDRFVSCDKVCVDRVDDGEDVNFGAVGAGEKVCQRAGAEERPDVGGGSGGSGSPPTRGADRCCTRKSGCRRGGADVGGDVQFRDYCRS